MVKYTQEYSSAHKTII